MLKKLFKKLLLRERADSNAYVRYLRGKGVKIGERTVFFDPKSVFVDEQYPWMIFIGDDVKITRGVTILTHGYDWSVLKVKHGDLNGSSGKVSIGNNVFVGMNTVILKGVSIGNDVIVGAGSVITKNIPDNCVAAGNPARVICSLDEYRAKTRLRQRDEAISLGREYYIRYGKKPPREIFYDYFWLFEHDTDETKWPQEYVREMNLGGNFTRSKECFQQANKMFHSFEDFLKEVMEDV